jgi:small subunit ribosomal protein S4
MARDLGPASRLCRREGTHLFLKGTKCDSGKCPADRRSYPPGQHGQSRVKLSDYGIQLREKQKLKRMYGMLERQFRRTFTIVQKTKGVTGQMLLAMLERRLDNVVYRLGFATSRREGRQLVCHGAVVVNGRRVTIASYSAKVGDVINIDPRRNGQCARIRANLERTAARRKPSWMQVEPAALRGSVIREPQREDMEAGIQEQLIVELYSK